MAEWTTAEVNELPDSAFLWVAPGGELDDEKKTVPRSLRHFPYKGPDGKIDLPHLRDAIGRIPQSDIPADKKKELQAKAEKLLADENDKTDRADAERVQRFDLASGRVEGARATPQGGLIVRGNLTRTGVFTYHNADGSTRRELRHPDDVFHPDSLASLAHAPVTIDHPDQVTPRNYRDVNVGHVAATPKRDGKFVAADDIRLQDAGAIDKVKRGDLKELSCGYSCRIDHTPGEYQGEPYDARQTNIRYNHVAMGPEGWGRAGPEVRMRLDGGVAVSAPEGRYVRADRSKSGEGEPMTDEEKRQLEEATSKRADAERRVAELEAKNKVLEAQASRQDSAAKAAEDAAKLDAKIEETIAVRETARRVLGAEWKHDGKSLSDVKREVLSELVPELGEDIAKLDGGALDAAYKTATARSAATRASREDVQRASALPHADAAKGMPGASGRPGDEDEKDDAVAKAQADMVERRKNAWKTGKKFDRKRAQDAQRSK